VIIIILAYNNYKNCKKKNSIYKLKNDSLQNALMASNNALMLSRIQIIEKQVKNHNVWNDLSIKEAYKLEKECLMRLSKTYKCICAHKRQHFPRIIKHDDKNNKLF